MAVMVRLTAQVALLSSTVRVYTPAVVHQGFVFGRKVPASMLYILMEEHMCDRDRPCGQAPLRAVGIEPPRCLHKRT